MSRTHGPHFVVPPAALDGPTAALAGDDAHHLVRVLRAGVGDPVSVADGVGGLWQGRVAELGHTVLVSLEESIEVPRPHPEVHVVHALPKGRKLDDVVRGLTELGVEGIWPVTTTRGESEPKAESADRALERWRAIAHAAAKQSRRAWLPQLAPVVPWPEAFGDALRGPSVEGFVCWEEATTPIAEAVAAQDGAARLVIGVGPEGGLTPAEVADAGLPAVTLGPTVLRTETAGLVAASAAMALLGRLR
ncbi:MAG: RsmE family RNA methyltransferase [Egibacteraceae bacterium]